MLVDEKLNSLRLQLVSQLNELKQIKMQTNFEQVINPTFEVYVVATMSSGKSTVLNAMLGVELLPSKNDACTAVISKIKHNPNLESYQARRIDKEGNILDDWCNIDYKTMEEWNNDSSNTHTIELEGRIPAMADRPSVELVLIDTPGPNNSQDKSHQEVTYNAINSEKPSMVLYVLNATQL